MSASEASSWAEGWAIIPAAGIGRRLRPHTHTLPKALLSVAGKPILAHILDEVVRVGIRRLALVVGERGEQIVRFAREHYPLCEVAAVRQDTPLGLGHAVFLAREHTDGHPVLIVYGDTIFEADLQQAVGLAADGAIGVHRVDDPSRFGVVVVEGRRILRLVEKPRSFVSDLAIVGVNFIRPSGRLFACLERLMSLDRRTAGEYQLTDALAMMVDEGARLEAFEVANWFDCGAPEALLDTNRHLLGRLPPPAPRPGVILVPPVYVSSSADIRNSVLGPHVSVGDGVTVADSVVRDSILADGSTVRGCFLEGSLVGEHAVVEAGARRLNVGDSSEVRLF